jgi:hypothetical protein
MSIKKKKTRGKVEVDLTGPQGNAYCLLGLAKDLSKQLGRDWEDIEKRMTSSDYENLIKVFDDEFGAFVDLYR